MIFAKRFFYVLIFSFFALQTMEEEKSILQSQSMYWNWLPKEFISTYLKLFPKELITELAKYLLYQKIEPALLQETISNHEDLPIVRTFTDEVGIRNIQWSPHDNKVLMYIARRNIFERNLKLMNRDGKNITSRVLLGGDNIFRVAWLPHKEYCAIITSKNFSNRDFLGIFIPTDNNLELLNGSYVASVDCIDWNPQNCILALGLADKAIRLWNLDKNSHKELKIGDCPSDLAWNLRHEHLLSWSGLNSVQILDIEKNKSNLYWTHKNLINKLSWNTENCLATTHCNQSIITITNLQDKKIEELKDHESPVTRIAWHPRNAHLLVSGSWDKTVRLWDLRMNKVFHTKKFDVHVHDLAFAPHFPHELAVAADNNIHFLSLADEKRYRTLVYSPSIEEALAMNSNKE